MSERRPDDLELLTAYADGALEPDERARVEALLEHDESARAELAEIRKLLDEVREAQPTEAERDWDATADAITDTAWAAHEDRGAMAQQTINLSARRDRKRQLSTLAVGLAAAAAVTALWMAKGPRDHRLVPPPHTAQDSTPSTPEQPPAAGSLVELSELEDAELEALEALLAGRPALPAGDVNDDDPEPMDADDLEVGPTSPGWLGATPVDPLAESEPPLTSEELAVLDELVEPDDTGPLADLDPDPPGFDPFASPGTPSSLEELDDESLEELEQALDELEADQAG